MQSVSRKLENADHKDVVTSGVNLCFDPIVASTKYVPCTSAAEVFRSCRNSTKSSFLSVPNASSVHLPVLPKTHCGLLG